MWQYIDELNVPKDYLQVFKYSMSDIKQKIEHIQENTEYKGGDYPKYCVKSVQDLQDDITYRFGGLDYVWCKDFQRSLTGQEFVLMQLAGKQNTIPASKIWIFYYRKIELENFLHSLCWIVIVQM